LILQNGFNDRIGNGRKCGHPEGTNEPLLPVILRAQPQIDVKNLLIDSNFEQVALIHQPKQNEPASNQMGTEKRISFSLGIPVGLAFGIGMFL
jgi:hypothetical protein